MSHTVRGLDTAGRGDSVEKLTDRGARVWSVRRAIEIVLAISVLIYAVRTGVPVGQSSYSNVWFKLLAALVVAAPGVWLIVANSLKARGEALVAVGAVSISLGAIGLIQDWTRFASAGAAFALAATAFILCAGALADSRRPGA